MLAVLGFLRLGFLANLLSHPVISGFITASGILIATSQLKHIEWNFPDVELRIPDIGKARRLLAYEPKVELEEGLERTIAWYRAQIL